MLSNKDEIISNLLQKDVTNSNRNKTLIRIIDNDELIENADKNESIDHNEILSNAYENSITVSDPSTPTILEMMIIAQKEANLLKKETPNSTVKKLASKEASKHTIGLKKGFFNVKKTKTKELSSQRIEPCDTDIIDVKKNKDINNSLVFDDVQKALEEDQHPMLKALKQKEWITPDLTSKIQSNNVLTDGLKDPNCMAAINLMQTDPKKAMLKYQNDPKVTAFLKEFGATMANHFEDLSATNSSSNKSNTNLNEGMKIQEIPEVGPLHAKVLSRADKKDVTAIHKESSSHEADQIKQILQDDELREMLMDPILQQILIECGEPDKFRKHMQNPDTAKKIIRLQNSGLVSTLK